MLALFRPYRRGGATCGVQPAGPRDNMNTSSTENTSVIHAPHEATYSITQVVFIGTIGNPHPLPLEQWKACLSSDSRNPVRGNSGRQHYGDDLLQDRQATADHKQLLPLLSGCGRLRHRSNLHASVHRVHSSGLLASGTPSLRHLAGSRLPR